MTATKPKPRPRRYCSFCGKEQAETKKMIAGPSVQICDACVNVCKTIMDRELAKEEAFKPTGMTLAQFKIGGEFLTEAGHWICTDKGTRSIAAKKVAEPNGNSSPLALREVEIVFDETKFGLCTPVKPVKKKPRR